MSLFTQAEILTLITAHNRQKAENWPLRPRCDERGCDCHPHSDESAFEQWKDNGLCRSCNDRIFKEEQSELRGLRALGF